MHDKRILGNVCLKETNTLKLFFDYHCQNFHLCTHNGSRILQPKYFILQPVSPILFDVNGAIDSLSDEKGTGPARHGAILNSMVHSLRSESTRYYPSPVSLEKYSFASMLSLAFYSLADGHFHPK